jgi:hypothetical protein
MEDFFDRRYLSEETVKEIGIGTAEGARSFAYSIRKDVLKGGRYLEIITDAEEYSESELFDRLQNNSSGLSCVDVSCDDDSGSCTILMELDSDRDGVKVSVNNKFISASEEGTCLIVTDFFGEYSISFYAIGRDMTEYVLGGFDYIFK